MQVTHFPNRVTLIVLAALALMPLIMHTTLATQVLIFATGTLSVTFLLGAIGLLSFGQGLYFGAGAYACAIFLSRYQFHPVTGMILATIAGALLALVLGALIVRRRGVYFVMLTLAFAQMGYFAMLAFKDVTGGENGLSGLPRSFSILGLSIATPLSFYLLAVCGFLVPFLLVQRILASPLGSVLIAIRENEGRSEALGYPTARYKLAALTFAGAVAGLAGALHAISLGFAPPSDIELEMSQRLLIMSIIGGVGSPAGALAGSAFYAIVSEILSEIWARWLGLIAVLLIGIVLYLPGGLCSLGERLARGFARRSEHG